MHFIIRHGRCRRSKWQTIPRNRIKKNLTSLLTYGFHELWSQPSPAEVSQSGSQIRGVISASSSGMNNTERVSPSIHSSNTRASSPWKWRWTRKHHKTIKYTPPRHGLILEKQKTSSDDSETNTINKQVKVLPLYVLPYPEILPSTSRTKIWSRWPSFPRHTMSEIATPITLRRILNTNWKLNYIIWTLSASSYLIYLDLAFHKN